jgi:hypothetical protein
MSRPPDLNQIPELPDEIRQVGLDGNLVFFVGAGISMLVGLPSWEELAWKALYDLREKGLFNYSELELMKGLDAKKLLSIAEVVADQNGIKLDLSKYLNGNGAHKNEIYYYLNKIGCVCVTTNYDELLEPKYFRTKDGSSTESPLNRINQKNDFHAGHLNIPSTVMHLHGSKSKPETMVFTTLQYLEHYDDDIVKNFLKELFNKKTVMFMGYRLEEAEILEHILRKGNVVDTKDKRRFALMPFFKSQEPLYKKLYEYYRKSFGVHLLGYTRDTKDYSQLEDIFRIWSEQIVIKEPALVDDLEFLDEVLG